MTISSSPALHLPCAMGMDMRRRVPVPLAPDLYAEIEDSRERGDLGLKVGPFCARLLRQFFRLEFLSAENIGWLRELRGHLPGLELLDLINLCIAELRRAVQSGRLVPFFLAPQLKKPEISGATRRARAREAQRAAPAESRTTR